MKIKLLIGINNFAAAGAQKLVADQLNHFDRNRYELALLTFSQEEDKDNFFHLLPENVKSYKLDFKNFYDIKNWFKVLKILREYKPDVVLSHLFFSNVVLRVLKPILNYRTIIYEHNTYINKTKLQILLDKILSSFTYKIIAVSKSVKSFTAKQEKINPDKFVVIPNSIDYMQIRAEAEKNNKDTLKEKLGFKREDKLIINVARLNKQKNHKLLIDSFAEFSKRNDRYKLIILGDGPLHNDLNTHIRSLRLEEKVFLLGFKRNVLEYMLISELFVLTSKFEGFALVCIEAMAAGLSVVSTNVAGPDEYVINGFNGYLTKENKEDIVQKMQGVVNFGQNYFSENCKKTAQKYDIKNNIKELETIIMNDKKL